MKKFSFKSIVATAIAMVMAVAFATQVSAMAPNLSLVSNGSTIQTTVYGDPNSSVILDYYANGQLMGAGVIGYTNYSGYYTGNLYAYNYNIPAGAQVVVIVNGQQSVPATWPTNGGYNQYPNNNGTLSLSQTSVNMNVGQSQSVTINGNYYYGYGNYYISNAGSNVVSATISGSTINLYAVSSGTASITVCSNNALSGISYALGSYNANPCATLYVTVNGGYYNNPPIVYNPPVYYPPYNNYNTPLSVSNSNVQVTVGNTGTVTLYGNNYNTYPYNTNSYYVTSTNNGVANATVNGNTLSIYGTNAGTTTVTVCSTTGNQCATVYVTVIAPYYTNNGPYNYPYNNNGGWYWSYVDNCWRHY